MTMTKRRITVTRVKHLSSIPVGSKSTCQFCGRVVWLRRTSTVAIGSLPTGTVRYQWRPRRGSKPATHCATLSPTGFHRDCLPLDGREYALLPARTA